MELLQFFFRKALSNQEGENNAFKNFKSTGASINRRSVFVYIYRCDFRYVPADF